MPTYTELGQGTPLVFIHGLGSRKEAWVHQHPLAKKYRLIIPDLRGHGENALEEGITVKNFAQDIITLLDELGIESAFICGLSLGGIVAQEVYKRAPERVRGLILSNTTSYIHPFFASHFLYEARMNYKDEDYIDEIINRGLHKKRHAQKAREAFLIRDCYMNAAVAPVGLNYYPILLSINVPVLLIGSTCDKVTPILNIISMRYFTPKARMIIFPGTGHLSNIERPILFNHHVKEFIEGI